MSSAVARIETTGPVQLALALTLRHTPGAVRVEVAVSHEDRVIARRPLGSPEAAAVFLAACAHPGVLVLIARALGDGGAMGVLEFHPTPVSDAALAPRAIALRAWTLPAAAPAGDDDLAAWAAGLLGGIVPTPLRDRQAEAVEALLRSLPPRSDGPTPAGH